MATNTTSTSIVDREFLELRARILELAAAFDRIDRAGVPREEQRLERLRKAIGILLSDDTNRAEQVQLLFSRTYEEQWRQQMGV